MNRTPYSVKVDGGVGPDNFRMATDMAVPYPNQER